jgi:hypothetical protein
MDDFSQLALPERAAEVAADITEAEQPRERRRRVAGFARKVAESRPAAAASTAAGAGRTAAGAAASAAAGVAGRGSRAVRQAAGSGSGWLADQAVAMVPRLRVRDQAALRARFPGKSADEIAEELISAASRAAAATGGAAGLWAVVPVVTAFPAEVLAETLVVVGIEVKLVAELHEAFGLRADGNVAERMRAYLAAWAHRRGVFMIPGGMIFAPGSPLARLLRRRLAARAGRSTASLGPLLSGAVAGAMLNGSATRKLGREILRDLRQHSATGQLSATGPGEINGKTTGEISGRGE